jgi:hypothetical protein
MIVSYTIRGERFATEFKRLDQLMAYLDRGAVLDITSDQFEWQPCQEGESRLIRS